MTEALDPARTGSFTKLVSACGDDQTCPSRNSTATREDTLRRVRDEQAARHEEIRSREP